MLIMIGGKIRGCFMKAAEIELPASTSDLTTRRTRLSSVFSVCSDRIVRVRSMDRPAEIIVANSREKTARSFSLTRGFLSVNSRSRPAFASLISRGRYPIERSLSATAASVSASTLPETSLPRASLTL